MTLLLSVVLSKTFLYPAATASLSEARARAMPKLP